MLSAEKVKEILRENYNKIDFFEKKGDTDYRFINSDIIIFEIELINGERRVLKYYSLQKFHTSQKKLQKNNIIQEYETIKSIAHEQNIINIYDINEKYYSDELIGVYIVMEKFNEMLSDHIQEGVKWNSKRVQSFLSQMDKILYKLHYEVEKPVIHSDIKPSNIGIRKVKGDETFVLLDFDVATRLEKGDKFSGLSNKAKIRGLTPKYASPEQMLAHLSGGDVSNRSDIYSIGVIAIEMLTGMPPQKANDNVFYELPISRLDNFWIKVMEKLCHYDPKKRVHRVADAFKKDSFYNVDIPIKRKPFEGKRINKSKELSSEYNLNNLALKNKINWKKLTIFFSGAFVVLLIVIFILQIEKDEKSSRITQSENVETPTISTSRFLKYPRFVNVSRTSYIMGNSSSDEDDEKPSLKVFLEPFSISKHEITNYQYAFFLNNEEFDFNNELISEYIDIEDKDCQIINRNGKYQPITGKENHPVVEVSWYGSKRYCEWLSKKQSEFFRLPFEDEWEYAAKANKSYLYSGSNEPPKVAWYIKNTGNGDEVNTKQVGIKQPNSLGLYDMSGNVYEWCEDTYDPELYNKRKHRYVEKSTEDKVRRGGCWRRNRNYLECTDRDYAPPSRTDDITGFRVVKHL